MRLRWSRRAREDLMEIGRHIGRENPDAARKWVARLRRRALSASRFPMAGRVVPEIELDDVREVLLGKYRIVYQVREKEMIVLCVFEGHRLLRIDPEELG